jgi:hypothetical protein
MGSVVAETADARWSGLMIKHPGVGGRYGEDHEGEPGEEREGRGDVATAVGDVPGIAKHSGKWEGNASAGGGGDATQPRHSGSHIRALSGTT